MHNGTANASFKHTVPMDKTILLLLKQSTGKVQALWFLFYWSIIM